MALRKRWVFKTTPDIPSCHCATLLSLPDGELLCAWYAGSREGARDVAIYGARLQPGSEAWSPAEVIADTPGFSDGNPVLFLDGHGRLQLWFVTIHGRWWSEARVKRRISTDGGHTWGPVEIIHEPYGWMTRSKPIVLDNGDLLLPMYYETPEETQWESFVLISQDDGDTWQPYGHITSPTGNIHPTVVQRSDGELLMIMRTGGPGGHLWQSRSGDHGRTWSPAEPVDLPNPNSGIDMIRLRSGRLLLVYNHSSQHRTPLSLALSEDEGRTWRPRVLDVETAEGEFSYPVVIQTEDGLIHIAYTYRRTAIAHVTLSEEDLPHG
ncbi:MAG TPA: exo-alpha-sialidase [Caldilineae bacterium]|nr:exo-alpha-sialidase [Caldilineae bacterium]